MQRLKRKSEGLIKTFFDRAGLEIKRKPPSADLHIYKEHYPQESLENRRFYTVSAGGHLGFGTDFDHPYWTNLDVKRTIPSEFRQFDPSKDILYDLLEAKPLPIESDSAEIILSQYAIEHTPDSAANYFFKDAHRALKKGGILQIVTPNTELDVAAYLNKDLSYFHWNNWKSVEGIYQTLGYHTPLTEASIEQVFVAHFAANASTLHAGGNPNQITDEEVREVMNSMETPAALSHITSKCCPVIQRRFRENHMSWWSPMKLHEALMRAGFKRVNILAPCQSNAQILRNGTYFDRLWNDVATFVEAIK